jgi:hypothetical protein
MKSDSAHNSQRSMVNSDSPVSHEIETQDTNCPSYSVVASEDLNSAPAGSNKIRAPRSGVPDNHKSLIWDSETESSDPVAVPITEWPTVNEARTLDGRFSQWDSFAKTSSRDMTVYDFRVIVFGRKVADQLFREADC